MRPFCSGPPRLVGLPNQGNWSHIKLNRAELLITPPVYLSMNTKTIQRYTTPFPKDKEENASFAAKAGLLGLRNGTTVTAGAPGFGARDGDVGVH